jgi:hypothetical protein
VELSVEKRRKMTCKVGIRAVARALVLFLVPAITTVFTGCRGPQERLVSYPAEINIGETPNFPLRAAGYLRGSIVTYRPGLIDVSVAYNTYSAELQNAVTLYFYRPDYSFEQQYAREKNEIVLAHAGAKLIQERQITLRKDGRTYQAQSAAFVFQGVLAGQQQAVFSQLLLVPLHDHYFKVRSSAPLAHASLAESRMLTLVETIGWSF